MPLLSQLEQLARHKLLARNPVYQQFFDHQALGLAETCRQMSERFLKGGRLLATGRGPYATDAQHVSVEFVHPVIVGKRALPALALSCSSIETLARAEDIVMGFTPPGGDPEVNRALTAARNRGALVFASPCCSADPFQHQEMLEILYHTLWETVHVFFEHQELPTDAGQAAFLYPFLGPDTSSPPRDREAPVAAVAASIRMKVADDARLRAEVAEKQSQAIAYATDALAACLHNGGQLLIFGNGGSATDANDWAIDCVSPPPGMRPVPAVSLSSEPAILTALANDVGPDVVFLRQLIAQARPNDAVVAISTSGGSRNIIATLEEARKRNLTTIALLGYDGGEIVRRGLADCPIVVHCDYIPRIQEVQASIYHVIRELLEVAADA